MGLKRTHTSRTQGEHDIFGDEEGAHLRSALDEIQLQLTELTLRVNSQFTTIAAHAEIARQQVDFTRAEARADLDRTRDLMIGLIEQVRNQQVGTGFHRPGSVPGPSIQSHIQQVDAIEQRVDGIITTVEHCFARQRELADTMAALLETVLAERRSDAVTGLAVLH